MNESSFDTLITTTPEYCSLLRSFRIFTFAFYARPSLCCWPRCSRIRFCPKVSKWRVNSYQYYSRTTNRKWCRRDVLLPLLSWLFYDTQTLQHRPPHVICVICHPALWFGPASFRLYYVGIIKNKPKKKRKKVVNLCYIPLVLWSQSKGAKLTCRVRKAFLQSWFLN